MKEINIFQCIETLVALQLEDFISCIKIDFVFAKHYHGVKGIEGEFTVIYGDAVAVEP